MQRRSRKPGAATYLRIAALLAAITISACASSHKVVAARHTDCPYKQIEISDETYAADEETWVARCRDKRYLCSTTNVNNRLKYRCQRLPAVPEAAAPAPTP